MTYSEIAKPTTDTYLSKANFGDKVVDNFAHLYALRDVPIYVPLNGSVPLVNGDVQYQRVPAKFDGGTIVAVAAACHDPSTNGAVVITIKNGATTILSTNITLDQGISDTLNATVPAVIDTAHDDVEEGDLLEISVVSAGTGVTFCGVEITFRPAD
jgi:hypothetical protein